LRIPTARQLALRPAREVRNGHSHPGLSEHRQLFIFKFLAGPPTTQGWLLATIAGGARASLPVILFKIITDGLGVRRIDWRTGIDLRNVGEMIADEKFVVGGYGGAHVENGFRPRSRRQQGRKPEETAFC
jgi:hypothetical protein